MSWQWKNGNNFIEMAEINIGNLIFVHVGSPFFCAFWHGFGTAVRWTYRRGRVVQ